MNEICSNETVEISSPGTFPPKYYRLLLNKGFTMSKGIKGSYWGGLIICFGLPTAVNLLSTLPQLADSVAFSVTSQIVQYALQSLLSTGLVMMMINHSRGERIEAFHVFRYHKSWLKISVGASLLILLISLLGLLLLILPGFYFMYAYAFTLPLMLDRNLGVSEAMKLSRTMVKGHWFLVFNWSMFSSMLMFIGMLPLAIPLIWLLPALAIGHALLYLDLARLKLDNQA